MHSSIHRFIGMEGQINPYISRVVERDGSIDLLWLPALEYQHGALLYTVHFSDGGWFSFRVSELERIESDYS